MEANINTQDAGGKKPSLFGMITSPGEQFERMKTKSPVWGAFVLFILLGTVMANRCKAYLTLINTPEMAKELNGEGSNDKGFALGGGALVGVLGTPIGLFIAAGFYKNYYDVYEQ